MEVPSILSLVTNIIPFVAIIITIGASIQFIQAIREDSPESIHQSIISLFMGCSLFVAQLISRTMISSLSLDTNIDENLIEEIPTETPATSDMPSLVKPDYSGIFIKTLIIGVIILLIVVSGYIIIKYLVPFIKHKIDEKEKAKIEEAEHEKQLKNATLSELATDYIRQNKTQLEPFDAQYDPEMEALIEKYKVAPKKSAIVAKKMEQHNNTYNFKQSSM